jgi:hypothetical protein
VSLRHPQQSVNRSETSGPGVGFDSLASAMSRETKLLLDLLDVLRQQRKAVATEDLAGVDDTIFSAQRIIRTLAEARRKRRTLFEILGGDPDLHLDEVEDVLGPKITPEVTAALQELRSVALELSGELEVNRTVLQGAIQAGDGLIRALGGGGEGDPGIYGPQARLDSGPRDHGLIINRQI